MHYFRKKFFLLLFFSSVVSFGYAQSKTVYPADLRQLHQNVWNELMSGSLGTDTLQALCDQMTEQGAWPKIDYTSKQRGSWQPVLHLSYIQTMAKVWRNPGSDFYNNPKLLSKIHLALNYWLDNDLLVVSRNWSPHATGTNLDSDGK